MGATAPSGFNDGSAPVKTGGGRAPGLIRAVGRFVAIFVLLLALLVLFLWVSTPTPRSASPGWTRLADGPQGRGEVASAVGTAVAGCDADACLYVAGGLHGLGRTSSTLSVYDPDADAWHRGPSLPAGRHHAAAVFVDGDLYITGGGTRATSFAPVADIWVLRRGAGEWDRLPDMPEARLGHQLVAVDGLLYVVGGDGPSGDTLVLEPASGRWTRGAPIPERRDHLGAVVLHGEIWAIGGRPGDAPTTRVDVYDPAADEWRSGPALPRPVSAAAVGVLGGEIHVVGGEDPRAVRGGVIDRHLVLRDVADEWEDGPRPLVATHGSGWGVIDDRLYVFGGSRRQGVLSVLGWTDLTAVFDPSDTDGNER